MDRRSFLKESCLGTSLLFPYPKAYSCYGAQSGIQGQADAVNPFLKFLEGDLIDQDSNYLLSFPEGRVQQQRFCHEFLKPKVFPINLPSGYIVELGAWDGGTLDYLSSYYGKTRCIGYDVVNYSNRQDLIIKDVRNISSRDFRKIALGRNHVSSWHSSFYSRLAGLKYLASNLEVGGYLIEDTTRRIPKNIVLYGFEQILEHGNAALFKKVDSDAKCIVLV